MLCSISTIRDHIPGFDFSLLWDLNKKYDKQCSAGSPIFFPNTRRFTNQACMAFTRQTNSPWSWTSYPGLDIWMRLATWKLGLFNLLSMFPRVPLGCKFEIFALTHLLADPIDSLTSMLVTLDMCQARVKAAKKYCDCPKKWSKNSDVDWKNLALIMVSYDECAQSGKLISVTDSLSELIRHTNIHKEVKEVCRDTAKALAADRSTKFLPMTFAQIIFFASWVIALVKASSSEPSPDNWIQVEAHSIAFSSIEFWVTSAVVMGSVIGASQTEVSVPNLLQRFEYDVARLKDRFARRPSDVERWGNGWREGPEFTELRAINGGMYSWRPTKWSKRASEHGTSGLQVLVHAIVAMAVIGSGYTFAMVMSYRIPPQGPNCRHIGETVMLCLLILSFGLECVFEKTLKTHLFRVVFIKDIFFSLANIACMIIFQWGVFNRCSCWTMWGRTGLVLPEEQVVKEILMKLIRVDFPYMIIGGISCQLVFCGLAAWKYWDAIRVFIQRDDGLSNKNLGRRKSSTPLLPTVEYKGENITVLQKAKVNEKLHVEVLEPC